MTDLDSKISELYREQAPKSFSSEADFRKQLDSAATELFGRQPPNVGLPMRAFTAILVSLLQDYRLPLDEIKRRISGQQRFPRNTL